MKPGYKQTEVGVIPEDWEIKSLGDLTIKVGSGKTPTGGTRVYKRQGRSFMRSQNVGWGVLKLDDLVFIEEEIHQTFPSSELHTNDVLLNITGASIGRSAVADIRIAGGNVNQHVCIIRTNNTELQPKFLNLFMLSDDGQSQIDSFQAGGNREGLNFGQIRSLLIKVPPTLAEQRLIAEALSDVDELIQGLEKLIAKKRAIKTGTMQQLLTGKQRLSGFDGEWENTTLGNVINKFTGGGTPSRSNSLYWGNDIPWVTVKDFAKFTPFQAQESITKAGLHNSASHLIPKGTLITSTRMALGKAVIYEVDVAINQDLKALFPKDRLDTGFLFYWFQFNAHMIDELGSGSTVKGISLPQLKILYFALPLKTEQQAIAEVLSDMDSEIQGLEKRLEKTRSIKQGMMSELLTGKTRIVAHSNGK